MPWYLTPQALTIIAGLKATPPQHSRNTSDNPLLTNAGYSSKDADRLRAMCRAEADKLLAAGDEAGFQALFRTDADEVLAALFGDPDRLDWAFPDRAARRTALAIEIDAALAMGEAA